MDVNHALMTMDRRAKLSTAWVFVLLNVIFRDIHELFRPGMSAEMMAGTVNGAGIEVVTLVLIIWYAWKWPQREVRVDSPVA